MFENQKATMKCLWIIIIALVSGAVLLSVMPYVDYLVLFCLCILEYFSKTHKGTTSAATLIVKEKVIMQILVEIRVFLMMRMGMFIYNFL